MFWASGLFWSLESFIYFSGLRSLPSSSRGCFNSEDIATQHIRKVRVCFRAEGNATHLLCSKWEKLKQASFRESNGDLTVHWNHTTWVLRREHHLLRDGEML